jgi:hypothetical protein
MKYVVALNMRRPVRFDHLAALLVGTLAVLGAVLISLQLTHDHASNRASSQGSRLATDLATRIGVSSVVVGWDLGAAQEAITLGVGGLARSISALSANAPDEELVGVAQNDASQQLQNEIAAMGATAADGLDPYTTGLVTATIDDIKAELIEQNRQVDLANAEGDRSHVAVLGLTFAALGGVLVGLAIALKETRSGWGILLLGWIVAALAMVTAVLSAF